MWMLSFEAIWSPVTVAPAVSIIIRSSIAKQLQSCMTPQTSQSFHDHRPPSTSQTFLPLNADTSVSDDINDDWIPF